MAFGFTPKFEQKILLNGLPPDHYLAIALDTVKQLDWKISYVSKSGFIAIIGGGLFSTIEEFRVVIQETEVFITSKNLSRGMADWGKNKKHIEEFLETFANMQSSLSDEQLNEKLVELKPVFESPEQDKLTLPPPDFKDNFKTFLSIFIPRDNYFITPIIINVNIVVFALMVISGVSFIEPTVAELITWGANLRGITLTGQYWRLLTNVFLHIGIIHLVFNMYALMYIGLLLESYLGKVRFTAAYFISGIIASLTSIYWHPDTVSAGASGAIFGMYGVFLAMLTTNIIDKATRKPLLVSIGVFVVFNLMNGMKGGIDGAAHIGGLLSGLIIGYCYYPSLKQNASVQLKYIITALLFVAAIITSVSIYRQIPNDTLRYGAFMKNFSDREQTALTVFKMPRNSTNDEIVAALKDNGIANWRKNLLTLDSIDKLDLPVDYAVRGDKLREYCNLRIKSYGYIIKEVQQNNRMYQSSIDSCNTRMEAIVKDLKGN